MTANIALSLTGEPKTGKTHIGLGFPDPIAVFSFDLRGAELLLHKFPNKKIDLFKYIPPITTTTQPDARVEALWDTIQVDYKNMVESGKYKTVLIDPATMVWEIIRHAYAVQQGRETIGQARNYGEPNARMSWLIMTPLAAGMNVVVTNYLKDVYVNDAATGEKSLAGFNRTEGLVDVCITTDMVTRPSTAQEKRDGAGNNSSVVKSKIYKCRFGRDINGETFDDLDYETLVAILDLE